MKRVKHLLPMAMLLALALLAAGCESPQGAEDKAWDQARIRWQEAMKDSKASTGEGASAEQEEKAWDLASKRGYISDYYYFLFSFPNSKHADQAWEGLVAASKGKLAPGSIVFATGLSPEETKSFQGIMAMRDQKKDLDMLLTMLNAFKDTPGLLDRARPYHRVCLSYFLLDKGKIEHEPAGDVRDKVAEVARSTQEIAGAVRKAAEDANSKSGKKKGEGNTIPFDWAMLPEVNMLLSQAIVDSFLAQASSGKLELTELLNLLETMNEYGEMHSGIMGSSVANAIGILSHPQFLDTPSRYYLWGLVHRGTGGQRYWSKTGIETDDEAMERAVAAQKIETDPVTSSFALSVVQEMQKRRAMAKAEKPQEAPKDEAPAKPE